MRRARSSAAMSALRSALLGAWSGFADHAGNRVRCDRCGSEYNGSGSDAVNGEA